MDETCPLCTGGGGGGDAAPIGGDHHREHPARVRVGDLPPPRDPPCQSLFLALSLFLFRPSLSAPISLQRPFTPQSMAMARGQAVGRVQLVRRDGRDVSTLYGREGGGAGTSCSFSPVETSQKRMRSSSSAPVTCPQRNRYATVTQPPRSRRTRAPRARRRWCPVSTGGGTRRVQLVREGGGRGGGGGAQRDGSHDYF